MDKLHLAIELGRQRRYGEAIPLFLEILSRDGHNGEAQLYLGRSYHALGNFSLAIDCLQTFCRRHQDSAVGHFFLGRSYLSAGVYPSAADHLYRASLLNPSLKQARVLLAITWMHLRRYEQAQELLGRLVEEYPQDGDLYRGYLNTLLLNGIRHFKNEDYEYAVEIFEFLRFQNYDHILPHLYLGILYKNQGDISGALDAYETALTYSPRDELILYRTAILNIKHGKEKRAKELLDLLHRLYPDSSLLKDTEVEHSFSREYLRRGDYEKALSHAMSLLKRNTRDLTARLIVAESYRELGQFERAGNHYQRALEQSPQNTEIHGNLGITFFRQGELRQAEKVFSDILRKKPHLHTIRYYWLLSRNRDDVDQELYRSQLEEAFGHLGEDAVLWSCMGDSFTRQGEFARAEDSYRRALDSDSQAEPALRGLIDLSRHQEIEDLSDLLEVYLDLNPRDVRRHRYYIQILFQNEVYHEALKRIEQLLP
ncbi:MAG TPA: tetratricopeptide repeat protein, partial [Sediminispirochaeta sp.]|nr:tetratricopeptide repeat protein [Sediminispirochaeta sp.]